MTPTEKKYRQNIGKLFLTKQRKYNYDKQCDQMTHSLVLVAGICRAGYRGETGAYLYNLQTLSKTDVEWRKEFSVRCCGFADKVDANIWRMQFEPLTEQNEKLIDMEVDIPEGQ